MNIGFDAKRAFKNSTGLGHYSRTLIRSLANHFPEHHYFLFTPEATGRFPTNGFSNISIICPEGFPAVPFKSLWRSNWVKKDLHQQKIDIYHGLSHEIPIGIRGSGVKSVVTIHDLIFERYPGQYNAIDRFIYRKKFRYACNHANHIIAISKQTKQDIIDFYKIPEERITVCYQSCNPEFAGILTEEQKQAVRRLYDLPDEYYLYVGSVIERKNLLTICKALFALKTQVPLVVIGDGGSYKQKVKSYISEKGLQDKVIFLSEDKKIAALESFRSSADFPAIYQMASMLIYPSIFEGFGIPVLEALNSRLPVITSNISCMPETGGDAAFYVNPNSVNDMAEAIQEVQTNADLRNRMKEKGTAYAQNFTVQKCAEAVMNVYKNL